MNLSCKRQPPFSPCPAGSKSQRASFAPPTEASWARRSSSHRVGLLHEPRVQFLILQEGKAGPRAARQYEQHAGSTLGSVSGSGLVSAALCACTCEFALKNHTE